MPEEKKSPLKEITQPFIDLVHAPRALWGINLPYLVEGFAYWGVLTYLAMYFNQYVGLDDVWAGWMVGVLTAGITISMFFFGGLADRWGVRVSLIAAFVLLVGGRLLLAGGPSALQGSTGVGSTLHIVALLGILLVVLGYGMYQPAAYTAVRQFTSAKTAAMGYAMLYALMNLGGWFPTWLTPFREKHGISGTYWLFTGATVAALVITAVILTRGTVKAAIADAAAEREREKAGGAGSENGKPAASQGTDGEGSPANVQLSHHVPLHLWIMIVGIGVLLYYTLPMPWSLVLTGALLLATIVLEVLPAGRRWIGRHPLSDIKFFFFIFALIPVQTLFAHNWLTLPMYVERAYRESWPWISTNFEKATNFNPLLIFIFVPIVTALTQKRKVYNMMILGTLVMAAPTFLLAFGARPWTLVTYLVVMTVGEAMWQPRFLQYAAEIAPEGRTGAYMGVAQFPWFLTKVIVPLYSGWFLQKYCPMEGKTTTESMWLIYAFIAMSSTVLLILAKGWLGKDFKTKAD